MEGFCYLQQKNITVWGGGKAADHESVSAWTISGGPGQPTSLGQGQGQTGDAGHSASVSGAQAGQAGIEPHVGAGG